eukprot:XP_024466062.1 protein PLANT CADMIUM RESISTANCE 2 isoform X2 [Populus trichocarpa]
MDPSNPGASALEIDTNPQPAYPPPETGIPVGHASQYINIPVGHATLYINENPQHPHHHQQRQHGQQARWSSGLCDCCSDVPSCCLTYWCPCITFGRIAEITDRGTTPCAVSGAIYGLLLYFTYCSCLYSCLYRSKLRTQYMLEESRCNDFLVHCCCEPCALCQEYRELKHRGFDMASGWQESLQGPSGTVAPSAPVVGQGMTR